MIGKTQPKEREPAMQNEPTIRQRTSPSARKIWRAHIAALQKSGLTRAEYCRQHNLSHHSLRYWQKKDEQPGQASMTFVPVSLAIDPKGGNSREFRSSLKVEVGNRFRVEVTDDFSRSTLVRLITTLESCWCYRSCRESKCTWPLEPPICAKL